MLIERGQCLPAQATRFFCSGHSKPQIKRLPFCARDAKGARMVFFNVLAAEAEGDAAQPPPLRVMFAAGGTGGHVFPAIAIADALKVLQPSSHIRFVGTQHRLEASAVPLAGYHFHSIPAASLRRPAFSLPNLLLPFKLLVSLCAALSLIFRVRPEIVVGTGGYVSGPLCIAAALTGCPFVIQEQNAYPGLTNRALSRFATTIFVAFAAAIEHFPVHKCVLCGNPVRSSLQHPVPKTKALEQFFDNWQSLYIGISGHNATRNKQSPLLEVSSMEKNQRQVLENTYSRRLDIPEVILVLGGSLGAQSINQAMSGMVLQMLNLCPRRFVIWQTGSKHYKEVINKVGRHERLFITEFLDDMNVAYSAADIVVCRSGAITCSELLISGKPSILIPSTLVTDDHQTKNAIAMLATGASLVLPNSELNPQKLEQSINDLLGNQSIMLQMHESATRFAVSNAANVIAKEILELAAKRRASRFSSLLTFFTFYDLKDLGVKELAWM